MVSCARRKALTAAWSECAARSSSLRDPKAKFSKWCCVCRKCRDRSTWTIEPSRAWRETSRFAHLQRVHIRLRRDTLHVQPVQRPQVDAARSLRLEGEGRPRPPRRCRRRMRAAPARMLVEMTVEERGGGRRADRAGSARVGCAIIIDIIIIMTPAGASFLSLHHHAGACAFGEVQ